MKIQIDTSAPLAELDALVAALRACRPDWAASGGGIDGAHGGQTLDHSEAGKIEANRRYGEIGSGAPNAKVDATIDHADRPDVGADGAGGKLVDLDKAAHQGQLDDAIAHSDDPFKAFREANAGDSHGSADLDADAAKLEAMGGNAGATLGDIGVEVDTAGMPWDARIHAATKAKLNNGEWRQRRGVSPVTLETVTAQLKAAQAAPPAAAASVTTGIAPAAPAAPPAPGVAPSAPAAPAAPAPGGPIPEFSDLILFITKYKAAGRLTDAQVKLALTALQMPEHVPVLASRPDLIPAVLEKLRSVVGPDA